MTDLTGGRTLVENLEYWEGEYNYPKGLLRSAATRIRNLEELRKMDTKPSVGRIVHYVAYGTPGGEFPAGVCRAAVITEIYGPGAFPVTGNAYTVTPEGWISEVGLCVLNPTGQFFNRGVPYDPETQAPGTWHWPERV